MKAWEKEDISFQGKQETSLKRLPNVCPTLSIQALEKLFSKSVAGSVRWQRWIHREENPLLCQLRVASLYLNLVVGGDTIFLNNSDVNEENAQ